MPLEAGGGRWLRSREVVHLHNSTGSGGQLRLDTVRRPFGIASVELRGHPGASGAAGDRWLRSQVCVPAQNSTGLGTQPRTDAAQRRFGTASVELRRRPSTRPCTRISARRSRIVSVR